MRVVLKAWLPLLALLAVVASIYLLVSWPQLSVTHRLSFAVTITIVLHILEEERFPGGFGYMFNVIRANSDAPDRYPMNPLIAMIVDVGVVLVLFVPALLLPTVMWLAAAPMFLALMEFFVHGGIGVFLQWRRRGLSIYNPGLLTAALLATIGVGFIVAVVSAGSMSARDWLCAVAFFVAAMIVCLVVPEFGLRSKTTRRAFDRQHFLGYYQRYTTVEEVLGPPQSAPPH